MTTYQQVAEQAIAVRRFAAGAFGVLDEVHHAGDDRVWGDGVRTAFETAPVRLCPSGTPSRSDEGLGLFGSLDDTEEDGFDLELADAPHLASADTGTSGVSPVRWRRVLRDANALLVRAIAGASGMTHAQVNGELNRMSGVKGVAEATADDLEKRRAHGARWLGKIGLQSGSR